MCKNFDLALLLLLENNKINDVKIAEATGVSRAALSKLRKQATERKTRFFNESRILSLKKNLDLSVCLSREINLLVRGSDALIKKFLVDGDGNESLAILNLEESDFGDCIVELLDKIYEVPEREVIISTCNIKKFKELLVKEFNNSKDFKEVVKKGKPLLNVILIAIEKRNTPIFYVKNNAAYINSDKETLVKLSDENHRKIKNELNNLRNLNSEWHSATNLAYLQFIQTLKDNKMEGNKLLTDLIEKIDLFFQSNRHTDIDWFEILSELDKKYEQDTNKDIFSDFDSRNQFIQFQYFLKIIIDCESEALSKPLQSLLNKVTLSSF